MLDSPIFAAGFMVGFAVAGFIAFLYNLIREWRKKISAYRKPQILIQRTSKSPAEVARDATAASARRTLTWMLIVLLSVLVVGELFLNNFIINVIRSAFALLT